MYYFYLLKLSTVTHSQSGLIASGRSAGQFANCQSSDRSQIRSGQVRAGQGVVVAVVYSTLLFSIHAVEPRQDICTLERRVPSASDSESRT